MQLKCRFIVNRSFGIFKCTKAFIGRETEAGYAVLRIPINALLTYAYLLTPVHIQRWPFSVVYTHKTVWKALVNFLWRKQSSGSLEHVMFVLCVSDCWLSVGGPCQLAALVTCPLC